MPIFPGRFSFAGVAAGVLLLFCGWLYLDSEARAQQQSIVEYRDVISTSIPGRPANHTLQFRLNRTVSPAGWLELRPPPGFFLVSTSTFGTRNVELLVNGSTRYATGTNDTIEIFPGSPGLIRYTLDPTSDPILSGSQIEFRVGNHTSRSLGPQIATTTTATTTATTTIPGDIPGITNSATVGTHRVNLRVFDVTEIARADFLIALIEPVRIDDVDTTSDIPPIRSEGQPEGTISGTTRAVEVSMRTNKFAFCHYATSPDVDFNDMSGRFDRPDFWVFHTFTVDVMPEETYRFYVRCIDLEDNINPDDYLIEFSVGEEPTGEPNPDGEIEGDGSGSQDEGAEGATGEGEGSEDVPSGGSETAPGGGGSGGGGGGSGAGGGFEPQPAPFESGDARVIISGFAYPGSRVTALVDGLEYTQTTANAQGQYSVRVDNIARGVYTFGVFATDPLNTRSSTFSTTFTVAGARTSTLSNIHVPPSIRINPDPVDPGQILTISGFALPNASITIEHEREGSSASRQTFTTTSDSNGQWSIDVNTTGFPNATHRVRARAAGEGVSTNFSNWQRYGVGDAVADTVNADLNRDGRVNLIDFSILLFWWGTDGGNSDPPADINRDGTVNLIDFSILLFNWTG